jgi:hypothetical protein
MATVTAINARTATGLNVQGHKEHEPLCAPVSLSYPSFVDLIDILDFRYESLRSLANRSAVSCSVGVMAS